MATIKFSINESLDSIKESVKCLQLIDEISKVHIYEHLHELGKNLKKLKGLKPQKKHTNLATILSEKNILNSNVKKLK